MFEAEAFGLSSMSKAKAINLPTPYCTGISGDHSFIAMTALAFGPQTPDAYTQFGRQLAHLHHHQESLFGADLHNTIGSTPQINTRTDNWFDFWREHRLTYQLDLARQNGATIELIDAGFKLSEQMEDLFVHPPAAACLHGDLWQGNWAFNETGAAFIFDPAHYFGDRETDIAMTTLFGRAHPNFYASYHEAYPLSDDYKVRETFYNIYHILNHYNLFGGGYAAQALHMIRTVLSELH